LERAARDLLTTPGDAQAIKFAVADRLEDKQVLLKDVRSFKIAHKECQ
jgi:hypothetical protein